jgi:hypothetical protein
VKRLLGITALLFLTVVDITKSLGTVAQPVPIPEDPSTAPQIEISGVGIASLGFGKTGDHPYGQALINFSDSALLVGAAQRLFESGIGSFGLAGLTTDATVRGPSSSLFLHQAFLDFQTKSYEVLVGRTDNPTAHLVDFPTLRGDDLITLTNPLNPFSNGGNVEEHRYSNVASVTVNQGLTYFESIHVQHLINSADGSGDIGINSAGLTFEYMGPPGMEAFQTVPSWGVGYEYLMPTGTSSRGLQEFYAGGVLNLNESVTDRIDLRVQNILSLGSDLKAFATVSDSFRADSNAVAASLRYLHSPFGKPGYQLSLTGGLKKYFKVATADSFGFALTAVRRLGQGFDVVLQYQGQWRNATLANAQSNRTTYEQTVEAALVFNFDATINRHITPRRTLLNLQHQYVPE